VKTCPALTHGLLLRPRAVADSRPREKGYILLTLLLAVSLMVIAATALLPSITFAIQRDKEQEMIHRGVQYSRAVRGYYKKYGRYPTKLEDLDNTNNLRYLRKHYKDPLTGQDFKLLHFGDPGVTLGGGLSLGGGTIPGASAIGSPAGTNGSGQSGSGFGGGSSFGNSGFGNSGSGNSAFGNSGFGNSGSGNSGVNSNGVFSQSSGFGGNTNSGNSNSGSGTGSNSQTTPGQDGTAPPAGSDPTQASSPAAPGTTQGSFGFGGQPASGGPIVGVASISKKTTIREFNKKTKYNDWQFIYDPSNEPRAGIIMTPNQPLLQGLGQTNLNGQQPGSTNSSSPFGTPNGSGASGGFGNNSSGFGNNSSSFGNNSNSNTPTQPAQPTANPPQQQ
jgi:type II secretory pathway pseudopilin PulG